MGCGEQLAGDFRGRWRLEWGSAGPVWRTLCPGRAVWWGWGLDGSGQLRFDIPNVEWPLDDESATLGVGVIGQPRNDRPGRRIGVHFVVILAHHFDGRSISLSFPLGFFGLSLRDLILDLDGTFAHRLARDYRRAGQSNDCPEGDWNENDLECD